MGLGSFLKRIALPVAGMALGGPLLGALGGIGGGAAGGGLGALIGGFQSSNLGQALGLGLKGVSLFSSFQSGKEQIRQQETANRIQAANTLEAIKLFPIKQRALEAEKKSLESGRVLEREQVAESRARITRSQGFGAAALGRESLALEERVRQLSEEEQKVLGTVSAQAAASGIRVSSQAVQLRREDVSTEAEFAQAQLQLQKEELEQQGLELQQQFQDALFDADFQEKINVRNEQLSRERIAFDEEVAREKEKTARHIAALQGITIPGEGPEPESPEAKEDRERRQREEEARMRGNIDPTISNPQNMMTVPGSGTPFSFNTPFGVVGGTAGTTQVDITTQSGLDAIQASGIPNFDFFGDYGIDE
jgi:hypothetical protein